MSSTLRERVPYFKVDPRPVSEDYNCGMGMLRGDRILIERRTLGINQDVLAQQIGVDRSYISRMERDDDVNVGIKTLTLLAHALGVTLPYLLGYTDNPLPEHGGAVLNESHVVYEVDSPGERRRMQRLVDMFAVLSPRDQDVVLAMTETLRVTTTPRIIGDE